MRKVGQLVHEAVMNGENITNDSTEGIKANEIVSYIIPKKLADRILMLRAIALKQTIFVPVDNGVQIYYPCGTKRFIANSWYNDINTDEL